MSRENMVYEGKRTLACIVASLMYAIGVNLFVVPAQLYSGGLMGICQVIRTLLVEYLHMNFHSFDIAGIIYYIINVPIFIIAFTRMGRKFFAKTLVTVTAMTVFLSVVPIVQVVDDTVAACVVGGIVSGAGIGIILRMASSGGGLDVVGVLLTKWRRDFSVGKVYLIVNLSLYIICLFLFDIEIVVYSVIFAAVHSLAIDKVHIQNINVEANIITKLNNVDLEKAIMEEIGRGLTKWTTLGAYTYEQSHMLYITLSKYEVSRLKAVVHKYDPNAFIVINEGVTIDGNFLKKL
ncbi:YitT family protein [uncultured Acetatifactor sp.]|uniref:YitT family protein n=1 Tax=uncultured Acetatifactor sp. TaxID=1671927 RepID=UPI00260E47DD|nr:YitT family protein [uncultured Acetatifactor sp.]